MSFHRVLQRLRLKVDSRLLDRREEVVVAWKDLEELLHDYDRIDSILRTHHANQRTNAALDVLAERHRQIKVEGWTPEHDDEHGNGEMAAAAAFYALHAHDDPRMKLYSFPMRWPWLPSWWKPGPARRMLVKAGALILAEIERLDRKQQAAPREGEE